MINQVKRVQIESTLFLFFPPYPLFHILSILIYRSILIYNIIYIPPDNFCLGKTQKLDCSLLGICKLLLRQNKNGQILLRQICKIKHLIFRAFYIFA